MHQKSILFLSLFIFCGFQLFSQTQPVSFRNEGIYDFLDELANKGVITINDAVKPYACDVISSCLMDASIKQERLTLRQQQTLTFYLIHYNYFKEKGKNPYSDKKKGNLSTHFPNFNVGFLPPGLLYKGSLLTFSVKPVFGIRNYVNANGNVISTWGGAEAYANLGSLSIYASLHENHQSEILAKPSYYNQYECGDYNLTLQNIKNVNYSEMRGGVVYGWNWGSFGIVKDQVQWGTNYHGATIFSGRNPSFAMIKLKVKPVKWFELNYIHGWLASEVVDSTRSYTTSNGVYRKEFRDKYIAANLFTFTPLMGISVSVGNSIVYSDVDVQPAYLIPFMFYKSIDHTLNHNIENQNSQMFLDMSIRLIRNLHLYGTLFVDEFSYTRIGDPNRHNFVGYKGGFRLTDWPFNNVSFTAEYTRTNPIVYKHRVPTTTFETHTFNLGHYLRDNSEDIYSSIDFRILKGLLVRTSYEFSRHGNEYAYVNGSYEDTLPFMKNITWRNKTISVTCRWEFIHNSYVYLSYANSQINGYDVDGFTAQHYLDLYTPSIFQGNNNTVTTGFSFGF